MNSSKPDCLPVNKDDFCKRVLGFWSSHPIAGLAKQRRYFLFMALIPLMTVLGVGVFMLTEFQNWSKIASFTYLFSLALACAIGIGAFLMALLCNRTAFVCASKQIGGAEALPLKFFHILLLCFLWVLPLGLSFIRQLWDGPQFGVIQFALNLLCFLPIIILLVWLAIPVASMSDVNMKLVRRPLFMMLGCLLLGLALLSLLDEVRAVIASSTYTHGYLAWLVKPFGKIIAFASLFPVALIFFALWQMWPAAVLIKQIQDDENVQQVKPSFWSSLFQKIKKLFTKQEAVAKSTEDDKPQPPAWLFNLLEHLPAGCDAQKPEKLIIADPAPFVQDGVLSLFIGLERPTEDQKKFFDRFVQSYLDVCFDPTTVKEKQSQNDIASADLLLQGDSGSGRTSVLIACALYAAIVRAQRVLILVPDEVRVKSIFRMVSDRLEKLMLGDYLKCGLVTEENVSLWCIDRNKQQLGVSSDEQTTVKGDVLPQIFIATPSNLEEFLYCSKLSTKDASRAVKHILLMLEVILVDDFIDNNEAERCHLPFLLDKQRLLLSSEYIQFQTVVVTPRLETQLGVQYLGVRLFTEKRLDKVRNVFVMRPRPMDSAWGLSIRAEDVTTICDELVKSCLKEGLDVVLYRKGMGENQRVILQGEFAKVSSTGTIHVVNHLDLVSEQVQDNNDIDAVFFQTAVSGDASMALRLRMGGKDSVFIKILSSNEKDEFHFDGVIPLVADRTSVPFQVMHLKSILKFFSPRLPIPTETWSQLGVYVNEDKMPIGLPVGKESAAWLYDVWNESVYGTSLWSYLALFDKTYFNVANNVSEVPFTHEALFLHPQLTHIFIGKLLEENPEGEEAKEKSVYAQWVTSNGEPLKRINLTHTQGYCLEYGTSTFVPGAMRKGKNGVEIVTDYWQGDGSDYYIPIKSFNWDVDPTHIPDNPSWSVDNGWGCYIAKKWNNLPREINVEFDNLMSVYGLTKQIEAQQFTFSAHTSALVFCPRKSEPRKLELHLQAGMYGGWSSSRDRKVSSTLTHAFAYALQRLMPGWSFFATCLGFDISSRNNHSVGEMAIWIIEPASSGLTLQPLITKIFEKQEYREKVLMLMSDFICRIKTVGDANLADEKNLVLRKRAARQMTRIGFSSDSFPMDDIERCQSALGRMKVVLDGGMESEAMSPLDEGKHWDPKTLPMPYALTEQEIKLEASWSTWRKDENLGGIFEWICGGAHFEIRDWIPSVQFDKARYLSYINEKWDKRISGEGYLEYIPNDPYLGFILCLAKKVAETFEKSNLKEKGVSLAEFLLSFVQTIRDYQSDPENIESDFPRFPSETILLKAGDCEDSALLYAAVLSACGVPCAWLLMKEPCHAAVGVDSAVCPSKKDNIGYQWLEKKYIYAETATSGRNECALGSKTELATPSEVTPCPYGGQLPDRDIRIVNAEWSNAGVVVWFFTVKKTDNMILASYARQANRIYAEPAAEKMNCLGAIKINELAENCIYKTFIPSDSKWPLSGCYIDIFALRKEDVGPTGKVCGRFLGVCKLV